MAGFGLGRLVDLSSEPARTRFLAMSSGTRRPECLKGDESDRIGGYLGERRRRSRSSSPCKYGFSFSPVQDYWQKVGPLGGQQLPVSGEGPCGGIRREATAEQKPDSWFEPPTRRSGHKWPRVPESPHIPAYIDVHPPSVLDRSGRYTALESEIPLRNAQRRLVSHPGGRRFESA